MISIGGKYYGMFLDFLTKMEKHESKPLKCVQDKEKKTKQGQHL